MAEYIEREALLKELQEEIDVETTMYTEEQNKWFNVGLKCAIRDVKHQPKVDLVELKHGTWYHGTENGAVYAKCSACGRKMNYSCYGYAYCALCGARMDGTPKERGGAE